MAGKGGKASENYRSDAGLYKVEDGERTGIDPAHVKAVQGGNKQPAQAAAATSEADPGPKPDSNAWPGSNNLGSAKLNPTTAQVAKGLDGMAEAGNYDKMPPGVAGIGLAPPARTRRTDPATVANRSRGGLASSAVLTG